MRAGESESYVIYVKSNSILIFAALISSSRPLNVTDALMQKRIRELGVIVRLESQSLATIVPQPRRPR